MVFIIYLITSRIFSLFPWENRPVPSAGFDSQSMATRSQSRKGDSIQLGWYPIKIWAKCYWVFKCPVKSWSGRITDSAMSFLLKHITKSHLENSTKPVNVPYPLVVAKVHQNHMKITEIYLFGSIHIWYFFQCLRMNRFIRETHNGRDFCPEITFNQYFMIRI